MTSMHGTNRTSVWLCAALLVGSLTGAALAQTSWQQRMPGTQPPKMDGVAMAYDPGQGEMITFGGQGPNQSYYQQTWKWNANDWTQLNPVTQPPIRSSAALVYDGARNVLLLFGGYCKNVFYNDTWTWNGTIWTQLNPATRPSARHGHKLAYDAARKVVVLFGGTNGKNCLNDTWEWNGTTWANRTPPSGNPPVRYAHAMAYDAARKRVVLFGGRNSNSTVANDTWEWDGKTWQRFMTGNPPGRQHHTLAYDALRQCVVLHAGGTQSTPYSDTWERTGTTWTQVCQACPTGHLAGHTMAYDARWGCMVVFGGSNPICQNKTWEYGPTTLLNGSGPTAIGTTHNLYLRSFGDALRVYHMASSLGTGPIPLGNRNLGLSFDCLFSMTIYNFFPANFQNFTGVLDAQDRARAWIAVPKSPVWKGLTIHTAFIVLDASAPLGIKSLSNTYSFTP